MSFFKRVILFRARNALLNKAHIMNLQTTEALCSFCILPLQVDWNARKLVETRGKFRSFLTNFLFLFQATRTAHFLLFMVLRMLGLQSGVVKYGLEDKLLDYGWLAPIACTIFFRTEFVRKKKETIKMMNEAHQLEREAADEGG